MKIAVLLFVALATLISTANASCQCGENFSGFGTEPGKCGCCPWPCCCKCFETDDCTGTTTPECDCVELAFLIDGSGSIGKEDWRIQLEFVQSLVDVLKNGFDYDNCGEQLYVAVIQFANNATLNLPLTPASGVTINTETVPQMKKATNVVEGMELAMSAVFNSQSNCIPTAVILTDGRSVFRKAELPAMGAAMREAVDGNLICIAITSEVDHEQLNAICEPENQFSVLQFDLLIDQLLMSLPLVMPSAEPAVDCIKKEECICCCSPEQYFGGGFQGYYGNGR